MQRIVKALELTGTVDEKHQLHLDEPLPFMGPSRVRVLILVTEEQEITEDEWLRAAAANAAFDFLLDPPRIGGVSEHRGQIIPKSTPYVEFYVAIAHTDHEFVW